MQDHFLKEIEIIDYKCFKNFKAKDFKRVNLISGKNNVGKTAFIEAINMNINSVSLETFIHAVASEKLMRNNIELIGKSRKEIIEIFKESLEKIECKINSNIYNCSFKLKDENGIKEFIIKTANKDYKININKFSYAVETLKNVKFIDNYGLSYGNLREVYIEIQKEEKENILNKYIKDFDPSISSFKLLGDIPSCKITDNDYLELNEFGDGLSHYIGIICTLYACKNGQLFIDEIDNGIHYTQLEKLWEIIFSISKEVNCQVFATTHSKEMINALAKVSEKIKEENISFIELGRNNKNEIKANIYDKEMFQYELNQNHEVRGW